jgi:hypothetical protein
MFTYLQIYFSYENKYTEFLYTLSEFGIPC